MGRIIDREAGMKAPVFCGKLVFLTIPEPEEDAQFFSKWTQDSEYLRLLNSDPARQWPAAMEQLWLEKELEKGSLFIIRKLEDERKIGWVELDCIDWTVGNIWLGIGIAERDFWGKGYGGDAMRVVINYIFGELNLERVSLTVFEYNERARHLYEKLGFREEGRYREFLEREGKRWDMVFMRLLRDEWEVSEKDFD
jgi:RimJ/RimL family protein N-acetyltransferase